MSLLGKDEILVCGADCPAHPGLIRVLFHNETESGVDDNLGVFGIDLSPKQVENMILGIFTELGTKIYPITNDVHIGSQN